MSLSHLSNSNIAIETTRKKTLQLMQKGIISYKLSCLGWDIADHYGDGYDLLCVNNKKTPHVIQLELKGVDLSYSKRVSGFSQSISQNEISTASHLIVSVFNGIEVVGHHIMSLNQLFIAYQHKKKKLQPYHDFYEYRNIVQSETMKKVNTRKGNTKKAPRLSIDIGCTDKKFNNCNWELEQFKNKWENLHKIN